MSGWPLATRGFDVVDTKNLAVSRFDDSKTVTAGGTPHTKGAWTEVVASTSQDTYVLGINTKNTYVSGADTSMLLDVAIGAAGSEIVVLENMLCGFQADWGNPQVNFFNMYIPKGSRIAMRTQALIASDTVMVGQLFANGPDFVTDNRQYGNWVTYGADTATSSGVYVQSATANIKYVWIEITPSTTAVHSTLGLSVQGNDSSLNPGDILCDIGMGAAGFEEVIVPDMYISSSNAERLYLGDRPHMIYLGRTIPIGTRLAVRMQASASTLEMMAALHGGF